MAGHTFWRGHLKLSLVTAAVTLSPARTQSNKVSFNILNKETGNRVESRYVDSVTHRPVADKNQVRGFPTGENEHVVLEEEEIDSVALESTRTIDIEQFVPRNSISWIWYDSPHFLLPSDKVGVEAYCVIREAMKVKDMVGIARLVLYRREHAVLLEPTDKGIVLWTLRYGDEVREPEETLDYKTKSDKKAQAALNQAIEKKMIDWKPSLVEDAVQKRVKSLIKTKQKSEPKPAKKKAAAKGSGAKIINIMDALKKSIADDQRKD